MTRDILMVFGGFLMGLLAGVVPQTVTHRKRREKRNVAECETVLPRSDRHGEKVIECGAEWTIM